ncbi:hypothetical protein ACFV23_25370 [Streptomyces sp. NPDC059627]
MIVAEYRVTGLSPAVIAELVAEVGPLRHEQHQARLAARPRRRAAGAGAKHKFVLVDRLLATRVSLRHGTSNANLLERMRQHRLDPVPQHLRLRQIHIVHAKRTYMKEWD